MSMERTREGKVMSRTEREGRAPIGRGGRKIRTENSEYCKLAFLNNKMRQNMLF